MDPVDEPHLTFSQALLRGEDFVGTVQRRQMKAAVIEAYAGLDENEDETENYRRAQRGEFARHDMLLKEFQHRLKINLQLIIAVI